MSRAVQTGLPSHDDTLPAHACEPRPACASLASHAGGLAVGRYGDRAFTSSPLDSSDPRSCGGLERGAQAYATPVRPGEFPVDILHAGDALQTPDDACVAFFHARLPVVKRLVVHAVGGRTGGSFGIYLMDCEGSEHSFLDFASASSATYAAMRIAQAYRLGVEFGNFAQPKMRGDSGPGNT